MVSSKAIEERKLPDEYLDEGIIENEENKINEPGELDSGKKKEMTAEQLTEMRPFWKHCHDDPGDDPIMCVNWGEENAKKNKDSKCTSRYPSLQTPEKCQLMELTECILHLSPGFYRKKTKKIWSIHNFRKSRP